MTTVYYFSATGNSLASAKIIAKKLSAKLERISKEAIICNSERVGFIFPVFFWGLPRMVEDFINKLTITKKNVYIFSIATCGGLPGEPLAVVNDILIKKGYSLNYGRTINTVANNIIEYELNLKSIDDKTKSLKEMSEQISDEILLEKVTVIGKVCFYHRMFHNFYNKHRVDKDHHFNIATTCNGCGICAKVCPAHNITVHNKKLKFHGSCEGCVACIQWCPKHAINWKLKTQKRTQYHYPSIKFKDMI